MTDRLDIDFTELLALADDFDAVGKNLDEFVRSAVQFTATNIKKDAAKAVGGRKHFAQAAAAIDYELIGFQGFGATVLDAEIGYNKGKSAGALGNLVEFGAPNSGNQLSPGGELQAALESNEADFYQGIAMAVDDAMEEVGL